MNISDGLVDLFRRTHDAEQGRLLRLHVDVPQGDIDLEATRAALRAVVDGLGITGGTADALDGDAT